MSKEIAIAREAEREEQTWSLHWQAATGRNFLIHPSLPEDIRGRLIGAHNREGRVLVDFLILPSEIHLISQLLTGDSIESVARSIANVVSRWVREVQPTPGHVMAGKYWAQRLDCEDDVRDEIRMLAWRPVHLEVSATKHHYPHGALRLALGLRPARGFNARPLLAYFGQTVPSARCALSTWLRVRPAAQDWRAWELNHGLELATGSVGPRAHMAKRVRGPAARMIAASGGYGVDDALELLGVWVGTRLQPAMPVDLHAGGDLLGARGRALVGCLAVSMRMCSASSVARHFHMAKSTLCERMKRCKAQAADRLILQTAPQRIAEEAAALRASMSARSHRADKS